MSPGMIETAKQEVKKGAETSFHFANEVEKIHAALYKKALDDLGRNVATDYYVCQRCGNTVEGEAPDKCPICGAPKSMFKKMD
jgi:rubrerythrin